MKNKTNIEEDIENVKFLLRDLKACHYGQTFINSLENILADRERLEKENRVLKNTLNKKDETIEAEKIEEKINKEELPLVIVGGRRNAKTLNYGIKLGRKQILQELLDEEK